MTKRIEQLKTGDTFEDQVGVGRYQPIYYAGASGDFNPIHIDPEFGKMVGLGGAILQGLCTMSFTAKAHVNWAGGDPASLKKIKVRFAKPVYPEDTVVTRSRVVAVEGRRTRLEFVSSNQNGVEVITRAYAELEID